VVAFHDVNVNVCVLNASSCAEHLQNVFGLRPKVCYKNIL